MNNKLGFLLLILLSTFNLACNKPANNNNREKGLKIKIEGFQLIDALGNPMARIGAPDNDWLFTDWPSLSSFEQSLLNSTDSSNTSNTLVSSVSFIAFPNPVSNSSYLEIQAGDSVKFKLVIADESGAVLKNFSIKTKGIKSFQLDLSDKIIFPVKKSVRY